MFCAGFLTLIFPYAFPLNLDDFSDETFFLQLHYCLFSCLFLVNISLKSQEPFVLFYVIFHLIFSGFCLFNLFVELSFWAIRFIFVYLFVSLYSFIYSFVSYYLSCPFELFSRLYLLFISCSLFLLNCANSVLCAV